MSRAVRRLLAGGGLILAATGVPAGAEMVESPVPAPRCPLVWPDADGVPGSAEVWLDAEWVQADLLLATSTPRWRLDDPLRLSPLTESGGDALMPGGRSLTLASPGVATPSPRPPAVVTFLLLLSGVVILRLR
jgi:hypothetical protein